MCLIMVCLFYQSTQNQDKVDGIGAESKINNNWENGQKWTLKIGGSMGWWPFCTIEDIYDFNVFFVEIKISFYMLKWFWFRNIFAL